ncbi:unnamed protein product [Fraxinus pennsylvanica]|uniref:Uncharacterized protein n=1 Tax=Fraxinus pennsylvanica TaxID=56036 RepID=A0AAD1ZQ13_9LAMI|nr:unnamed protein product [Fraxinus pennsylvanica]
MAAAAALHLMNAAIFTHENLPVTDRPMPKPEVQHKFGPNVELLTGDGIVPFGLELLARSMDQGPNDPESHNVKPQKNLISDLTIQLYQQLFATATSATITATNHHTNNWPKGLPIAQSTLTLSTSPTTITLVDTARSTLPASNSTCTTTNPPNNTKIWKTITPTTKTTSSLSSDPPPLVEPTSPPPNCSSDKGEAALPHSPIVAATEPEEGWVKRHTGERRGDDCKSRPRSPERHSNYNRRSESEARRRREIQRGGRILVRM